MLRLAGAVAAVLLALPSAAAAHPTTPRVIGGGPASRPYPHQAELRAAGYFICGGTLVAARYVLTAGHCAAPGSGPILRVGLGSADRTATEGYGVAAVERHPDFRILSAESMDFDVSLLTLAAPAPYEPLPLAEPGAQGDLWGPGIAGTVIGWGATADAAGPSYPTQLLEAQVPVRSDADCTSAYDDFSPLTMLCAGVGGVDTCYGDSGGPLLVPAGARSVLAGVTSWGVGCAHPQRPGVYARVAAEPLHGWLRARIPRAGFAASPAAPQAGQTVTLTSTSSSPTGYTAFAWDLDGDGAFDDGQGASVQTGFPAGAIELGLEASNAAGDRERARAVLIVREHAGAVAVAPATSVSNRARALRVVRVRRRDGAVVLRAEVPGPGRLRASARTRTGRRRTLAAGRTNVRRAGAASVRLRLGAAGRRILRRRSSVAVRFTLSFRPLGAGGERSGTLDGRLARRRL